MRWVVQSLHTQSSRQFRTAGELACLWQPCAMYSSSLCVHCRISSLNSQLGELRQQCRVGDAAICALRKSLDCSRVSSPYSHLIMCCNVCKLGNICLMRQAVCLLCMKSLIIQMYFYRQQMKGQTRNMAQWRYPTAASPSTLSMKVTRYSP